MAKYQLPDLSSRWRQGMLTIEQLAGQLLQYTMAQQEEISTLKLELNQLKQQMALLKAKVKD